MINPKARELLRISNVGRMLSPAAAPRFPDIVGTFMGRDALTLAISFLNLSAGDTVLLPAYVCAEVVRPFVGRTRVGFYDICPDLSVDPDALRHKLNANVKVVLVINYFGFLQPHLSEIKRMCSERGVVLIEDCAHSLLTDGAGTAGDLSIFSYRKLLPVPDGGGLRNNLQGRTVTPDYYPGTYSAALSMLVVLRSLFEFKTNLLSRAWFASRRTREEPIKERLSTRPRTLPLSIFTANGIAHLPFTDIIRDRRADFEFWRGLVAQNGDLVPAFSSMPEGVCPLGFPVKVKDRDGFRARLAANGIRTTVEWRLPESVGPEFVRSHQISRQILTLPLSPVLGPIERARARELLAG